MTDSNSVETSPKPVDKPKKVPKIHKWEDIVIKQTVPLVSALKYKIELFESFGDMIHDSGYEIEELFVPDYSLVLNVSKGGDNFRRLNALESSEPRIISMIRRREISLLHSKLYATENMEMMKKEEQDDNVVYCGVDPEDMDKTPEELNTKMQEIKAQIEEMTRKNTIEEHIKTGKIQKIMIPLVIVQKAMEILKLEKSLDQLKLDWVDKYD